MKCRRINPENGMIVWFGVKDVKISNNKVTPIFQNNNDKHDNYSSKQEAVINSLTQRLSVIKHELWYDYDNGLPLTDKIRNKSIVDAYVIKSILNQPDVINIEGFESRQDMHSYTCYMIVNTVYGQIELSI